MSLLSRLLDGYYNDLIIHLKYYCFDKSFQNVSVRACVGIFIWYYGYLHSLYVEHLYRKVCDKDMLGFN